MILNLKEDGGVENKMKCSRCKGEFNQFVDGTKCPFCGNEVFELRSIPYIKEECPGCGSEHIVKVEDKEKWQKCQECSK